MEARLSEVRPACMSALVGAPARDESQGPHWYESGPWGTPTVTVNAADVPPTMLHSEDHSSVGKRTKED
jgi:hypothetical protein